MLTILYGTRGARDEIYSRIKKDVENGKRAYLIVPDQKALLAEEGLMKALPRGAALEVDAVGFSRLANLVCRKYGSLTYRYATDGAKAVTMHNAIKKLRPKLKVFGGEIQNGTLESLISLMREFRTCSVSAETLAEAAEKAGATPLGNKLYDLSLIYLEYETELHKNFAEVEDDIDTLCDLLEENNFFSGADVYIDSFVSFTKQELTVISRMLARDVNVTVALPCSGGGAHMAECRDTRKKLLSLASKFSCELYEKEVPTEAPMPIAFAKDMLWDFSLADTFDGDTAGILEVAGCFDQNEEALLCLKEIYNAVNDGQSFSDIAIIARNAESYTGILDRLLKKCNIPFFFAKKTGAESLPLTSLILSALSLYIGDFKAADVSEYIKSGLVGLTDEECDIFDEYIDRWNINGRSRYLDGEDFTMSKSGYAVAKHKEALDDINLIKHKLAAPLMRFCDTLDGAKTVRDFAEAVYEYLTELHIKEASQSADVVKFFGVDKTEDSIRLWNIVTEALDTLVDSADDSFLSAADFLVLIKILFSAIDIASIPSAKDQIIIGNADSIRIDERKTVIILGAVEGVFPATVSESPTLGENERNELESLGITLSQNLLLRSARELYHFTRALDFATKRVVISYYNVSGSGDSVSPSFALSRLRKLFTNLKEYTFASLPESERIFYENAAAEEVGTFSDETEATLCELLKERGNYTPPLRSASLLSNAVSSIDRETAKEIYGENMTLSQSKIDTYCDCKFKHFLRYIIALEDTAPFEFNPMDTGTYVHSVVENFINGAIESGKKVADYTDEEIEKLALSLSQAETEKIIALSGKNARMLSYFDRIYRNIRLILKNIVNEFKSSSFEPLACEYYIGKSGHAPLSVELSDGAKVMLNGVADRVDILKKDGEVYLRIVDYKTGSKPFNESDIKEGKNLQLLIYLFSLCLVADKNFFALAGVESAENIHPGSALYFVVNAPQIKRDVVPGNDDDILSEAEAQFERKGFIFSADELAGLVDKTSAKLFSKKLVAKNSAETKEIYTTVCDSIKNVASEMRSGRIDTTETVVTSSTTCKYCKYKDICRKNTAKGDADNA
nr:PD-(D/E)XK nuclease family protein [Clostridia bacterium]